jgi:uncharacterized protein
VIALAWALLLALAWPVPAAAQALQPVPALSARVTDLTGTLDESQRAGLEAQLAAIEQRKGAQVAVLVVGTTRPEAIEEFSIRVVEQWKLGRGSVDGRKVDDGVLLLVAKEDRRVRIEVGYGLEGAIPDALARRIIAEAIAPRFRQGDYFGGLQAAVAELGRLIDGEALPEPWQAAHEGGGDGESAWGGAMIAMVVIGVALTSMFGRWLGSVLGGAGAGVITFVNLGALGLALVASAGMFALLLVLSSLLSMPLSPLRGGGRGGRSSSVWTSGSSGGWRSSGGGFSGGGGGFGGGGASGGW